MNFPNMSYCMCENTLAALNQVLAAMREEGPKFLEEISGDERRAFRDLFNACEDFLIVSEELEDQLEQDADSGDQDGDHGSALASVGWGTDEDYGHYSDDQ